MSLFYSGNCLTTIQMSNLGNGKDVKVSKLVTMCEVARTHRKLKGNTEASLKFVYMYLYDHDRFPAGHGSSLWKELYFPFF